MSDRERDPLTLPPVTLADVRPVSDEQIGDALGVLSLARLQGRLTPHHLATLLMVADARPDAAYEAAIRRISELERALDALDDRDA